MKAAKLQLCFSYLPITLLCYMFKQDISKSEIAVLILVLIIILTGFVLIYTNLSLFQTYTIEDGLVEWLTVLGLLLGSIVSLRRFFVLRKQRRFIFLLATFLLGIFLFFAAGEEISWGQRLLGIESSDYFKQNNTQGETNFHNLVLGGVRINRWIFSFGLITVLSIYVIIMPLLYTRKRWMKNFVDYWGIPLPQLYQLIGCVLLFILTTFIPHEKRAELLECGIAFFLFLIIAFPMNKNLFVKNQV